MKSPLKTNNIIKPSSNHHEITIESLIINKNHHQITKSRSNHHGPHFIPQICGCCMAPAAMHRWKTWATWCHRPPRAVKCSFPGPRGIHEESTMNRWCRGGPGAPVGTPWGIQRFPGSDRFPPSSLEGWQGKIQGKILEHDRGDPPFQETSIWTCEFMCWEVSASRQWLDSKT